MSGYFDLQVNGYAGIDFNQDDLTAEQLHTVCDRLEKDGVDGILATIITAPIPVMVQRLTRLRELCEVDEKARSLVAGIHIEGPFLSIEDGYRGAHPKECIRPANLPDMERLLDAAGDLARIVTLAPECDKELNVTQALAERGIIASGGHCNPTGDQLDAAIDAGLSMFTHLGNACPTMMPRHDNIIQRVLNRASKLWISFIADGIHIPPDALANYLHLAGDHAMVVSDAMAAAGLGPGRYTLAHWDVEVGDDLAAWAPGRKHLVGAAMSMKQMDRVLHQTCHLSAQHRMSLLSETPRTVFGL